MNLHGLRQQSGRTASQTDNCSSFAFGNPDFASRINLCLVSVEGGEATVTVENLPVAGDGIRFDPALDFRVDGQVVAERNVQVDRGSKTTVTEPVGEGEVSVAVVGDWGDDCWCTGNDDKVMDCDLDAPQGDCARVVQGTPTNGGGGGDGGGTSRRTLGLVAAGGAALYFLTRG